MITLFKKLLTAPGSSEGAAPEEKVTEEDQPGEQHREDPGEQEQRHSALEGDHLLQTGRLRAEKGQPRSNSVLAQRAHVQLH